MRRRPIGTRFPIVALPLGRHVAAEKRSLSIRGGHFQTIDSVVGEQRCSLLAEMASEERAYFFLVGGLGRRWLGSVLANGEGDKGRCRCEAISREVEKKEDDKTMWNNDEESVSWKRSACAVAHCHHVRMASDTQPCTGTSWMAQSIRRDGKCCGRDKQCSARVVAVLGVRRGCRRGCRKVVGDWLQTV